MKVLFNDLQGVNSSFSEEINAALRESVESGWYVGGKNCHEFEKEFAEYVGSKYCIGVGNGLDALSLVLMAWRISEKWEDGDEVILPANTFIATALAVSRVGLRPVFCDVLMSDALIDVASVESQISLRTRAIIPVHLYGKLCDMQSLVVLAKKYGLKILEDACQAHGAKLQNCNTFLGERKYSAGNLGDAAAFSFYPGKNLGALGDGGCVTTNDELVADLVRKLSNYGQKEKYIHSLKGCNSRLDEIQAAILRVKLRRLDKDNERRRMISRAYCEQINNMLIFKPEVNNLSELNVLHIFPVRCKYRNKLQEYLSGLGIQTLIHYPIPIHKQEAYSDYSEQILPNAELWANEELSLPISSVLRDEEIEYVSKAINAFKC